MTLAALLFVAGSTLSYAQATTVLTTVGVQYRFHGDTIWRERDTTSVQSVYRRDTVYRNTFVLGRKTISEVIVVRGDSATIIETRDGAGKVVAGIRESGMSANAMEIDRNMIEGAFRTIEAEARTRAMQAQTRQSEERIRAMGGNLPARPVVPTIELSPKAKLVYPTAANRVLEQLGDTVRYITGCTVRPPVDTVVYLLFANDSVRRLSPSPRMFDVAMARAVRADLNSAFARQRARATDNPAMKNVATFSKWPCDQRAGSVAASTVSQAQAATVVPGSSGLQYRYRGDTVWRERDTTATQSVYRRDTLYRSTFALGRKIGSEIFVMLGDSAKILEKRDASGTIVASNRHDRIATSTLDLDRSSLESSLATAVREANQRASDERILDSNAHDLVVGNGRPPRLVAQAPTAPVSPTVKQTYPFSANLTLEQTRDTVRYITGCAARMPVDTTIYLLFATDSVRRLSPSPRTFDAMMARAVRGDIERVGIRQRARPGDSPAMQSVPKLTKWPCDQR